MKAPNADKFPPLSPFKFSLEKSNSRWEGPGGTAPEVLDPSQLGVAK